MMSLNVFKKNRLEWLATFAMLGIFGWMSSGQTAAAIYSTDNATGGGLIRFNDVSNTSLLEVNGNDAGERRVGNSSAAAVTLNSIYFFELPEFDDFNEMAFGSSSGTSMDFVYKQQDLSPSFNLDVYGLGFTNSPIMDTSWFFEGASDSTMRSALATGTSGTVSKLAENVIVTNATPTGRVSVSSSNVRKFLASLYADGAQAGDHAVFRVNADADSNASDPPGAGFDVVHTAGNTNGNAGNLANITIRSDVIAHDTFAGAPTGSIDGVSSGSGLNTVNGWVASSTQPAQVVNAVPELTHTGGGQINGGSTAAEFTGAYNGTTGLNNNPLRRELETPFTGDDLYFRYMIRKTDGPMDSNDFVILWLDNIEGGDSDAHGATAAFLGLRGTGNVLGRVYRNSGALQELDVAIAGGVQAGETYTLVGHLFRDQPNGALDSLEFWIDPTSEDAFSPDGSISIAGANNLTQITHLGFRTGQFTELGDTFLVDGIVLGNSFASVVPVPEPSAFPLGLFGLAAVSVLTLRRRKRRH